MRADRATGGGGGGRGHGAVECNQEGESVGLTTLLPQLGEVSRSKGDQKRFPSQRGAAGLGGRGGESAGRGYF